jgi:hypothetical protein
VFFVFGVGVVVVVVAAVVVVTFTLAIDTLAQVPTSAHTCNQLASVAVVLCLRNHDNTELAGQHGAQQHVALRRQWAAFERPQTLPEQEPRPEKPANRACHARHGHPRRSRGH